MSRIRRKRPAAARQLLAGPDRGERVIDVEMRIPRWL